MSSRAPDVQQQCRSQPSTTLTWSANPAPLVVNGLHREPTGNAAKPSRAHSTFARSRMRCQYDDARNSMTSSDIATVRPGSRSMISANGKWLVETISSAVTIAPDVPSSRASW